VSTLNLLRLEGLPAAGRPANADRASLAEPCSAPAARKPRGALYNAWGRTIARS